MKALKFVPVAALLALALSGIVIGQDRPAPADPLTPEEREKAVGIARQEGLRRQQLQADRFSLVGVELAAVKEADAKAAPEPGSFRRQALVLFYRYDRSDGLQVLVDLVGGSVRELASLRGESVPIGREEVERAAQLALRNEQVRQLLGSTADSFRVGIGLSDEENTIEGLRTVGGGSDDPCTRQRCIDLFFRLRGHYVAGRRVLVNLSDSSVRVTSTERSE